MQKVRETPSKEAPPAWAARVDRGQGPQPGNAGKEPSLATP